MELKTLPYKNTSKKLKLSIARNHLHSKVNHIMRMQTLTSLEIKTVQAFRTNMNELVRNNRSYLIIMK